MRNTPSTQQPNSVETVKTKEIKGAWGNALKTIALLLALNLPGKVSAQEQTLPGPKKDSIESIISTPNQTLNGEGKKKESKLEVNGSLRGGSNVTPLLGSILSDTPAARFTIDASNPKSGLGISVIRFDDFNKSMDNPTSQLTMVDLYWQKKIGKISITGVGEYVNIDKIKGSSSFTPIIGGTYDAGKGWIFDARACYTIQKGENVAAFRAGVTKKFNNAFSLAAQVIHNEKLSGRFQAKVKLSKNLGLEITGIASDGKITPIAGVLCEL